LPADAGGLKVIREDAKVSFISNSTINENFAAGMKILAKERFLVRL